MQIIVTPSNGKLALIIDSISGSIIREIDIPPELQGEKNRPYGITKDHAGNWYISNWNRIGVFDADFNFKYAISNLPDNIHQIYYDEPSEELWICATSIDSLLTINLKGGFARRFCLVENAWVSLDKPAKDTQHFSSVHWTGSYLYVLAHKLGQQNSCLLTFDRSMNPIGRWSAGWEAHSICRFNGTTFIIDSRGGRVLGTNGYGLSLEGNYNAIRDDDYDGGHVESKYARGMTINSRGTGITSVFDFGNHSTRLTGDVSFSVFNIPDNNFIKEFKITGTGNIQDIQIYSEPIPTIYSDIKKYKQVTTELDKLIKPALAEEFFDKEDRMPYDPERSKPDFDNRLDKLKNEPIDYAAQKNLKRLKKGIEAEAERLLNELLPQEWKRSGGFWYPAINGYMDCHSNCEVPGPRIYLVWCAEGSKSRFLWSADGKNISSVVEPAGWSINTFTIGDKTKPFWHAVDSGGTDRISFGFKLKG